MFRMQEKKKIMHIMILYVLVLGLAVYAFASWATAGDDIGGDWACIQEVCTASVPAGEAWAEQNCGTVEDENGNPVEACVVTVDGQEQIVPRSTLNLSAIQQCTQTTCLQEVRVRPVNYTITPPQQ